MTKVRSIPQWLAVTMAGLLLFATVTAFFNPAQAAPTSSPAAQPASQAVAPASGNPAPAAQANAGKPQLQGHSTGKPGAAPPASPASILYDQYDNPGSNATVSQQFEPANVTFNAQSADDFPVPVTSTWSVNEVDIQGLYFNGPGPATAFNVFFYTSTGTLPGTPVYTATNLAYTNAITQNFVIPLTAPAILPGGFTYWVSAQAVQNFTPAGEFGWQDRSVQSNNPAAWRNPGGGFGTTCANWGVKTTCIPTSQVDNVFRLQGTVVGGGTPTPTATQCPGVGTWTNVASGPLDLYGAAGANDGSNAYFAGGYSFSIATTTNQFAEYNLASNTWSTLAPVTPNGNVDMATANYSPINNKVYVMGGSNFADNRVYDVAAGTWSTATAMPDVRAFAATGYFNGNIYVVGGYNTGNITPAFTQTWQYNIAANTWTTMTSVPAPLGFGGAGYTTLNGKLYVAGGRSSANAVINTLYIYDMASDTWTQGANLPTAVNVPGAAAVGGKVYVYGGGTPFSGSDTKAFNPNRVDALNITQVYDPNTNTWSSGPTMNSARAFPGFTMLGSTAIAYGGYNGSTTVATAEILTACGTPTATVTSTATAVPPTATSTATPAPPTATVTATPNPVTATPTQCVPSNGWSSITTPPAPNARGFGAYYPNNGNFYLLGGRPNDTAGNDNIHIYEYNPTANSWLTKTATFTSTQVNNMAGGVLNFAGVNLIVTVGGSAAGQATATSIVRVYNPTADVMLTLDTDPWPGDANGTTLPGGSTVYNNKLYIIGGFNINVGMSSQIWQFDPAAAPGSKWSLKTATLPVPLGYVPAAAIGNMIYTGGGSTFTGGTLADSTNSYAYNPTADTIAPLTNQIPRATGETRAVNYNNELWVLGGGRTAPNPSAEVDIYNPGTGLWRVGPPMLNVRRNFAADTDGSRIYVAGGYSPSVQTNAAEVYSVNTCGTPSPTSTVALPTATTTATPNAATATTTATPNAATATPTQCVGYIGSWTNVAPYPAQIESVAVASDGTYGYGMGGASNGIVTNAVSRYDTVANTWTPLAPLPTAETDARAGYDPLNNKVYLFGGYDFTNVLTNNFIYDVASNTWTTGAPLPAARFFSSVGYYNGKMYVVGGLDSSFAETSQVWQYDPIANTWNTTFTADPQMQGGAGQAVIGQYLYLMGAYSGSAGNFAERYDMSADTWMTLPTMPQASYEPAAGVLGGKIYVAGGGTPAHNGALRSSTASSSSRPAAFNTTQVYDPGTNTWSSGPTMNTAHAFTGGGNVGNTFIVVAGFDGTADSNVVEALPTICGTPTPAATSTATSVPATATTTATSVPLTSTSTPVATIIITLTNTPMATSTMTSTNTPMATSTMTSTSTAVPPTVTPLPSVTPTDCPNPFIDITGNIFYVAIHYLNCRGVINGTDANHYSPAGTATRGQFAKVVILGFGTPFFTPATQDFVDVAPSYFAYLYIESGFHYGILSGFDHPSCTSHGVGFPCYLPNLPITRGQLTKLVVNAGGYTLITPTGGQQDFTDVPTTNVFYVSIETAFHNGIIAGYPDHTFRPNNNIRRDEMAQIVYEGIIHRP